MVGIAASNAGLENDAGASADAAAAMAWPGANAGACEPKGSLERGTGGVGAWNGAGSAAGTLRLSTCACACLRSELTSSQALVDSTSSSSEPASSEPAASVPLSAVPVSAYHSAATLSFKIK